MPNPNAHDQPVEGGEEQVERALQKQSEPPPKAQRNKRDTKQDDNKKSDK